MKESYEEGVASHLGPESCVDAREGKGEALTGVRSGQVWSREKVDSPQGEVQGADAVDESGRQHNRRRYRVSFPQFG